MRTFFQKSATLVRFLLQFRTVPTWPIFEKCSHLREIEGVLIFLPGLYGGLYGQNLPYKSYGDFHIRNFEKITYSCRTTGPRSDLRPDSWSWANPSFHQYYSIIAFFPACSSDMLKNFDWEYRAVEYFRLYIANFRKPTGLRHTCTSRVNTRGLKLR